ncbi:MAG: hypothetical protein HOB14_10585 [Gammaproteobacteria bacterium]|jgi:hypothetical protein|nr:hypothetical protein [Gammaproteobacteria bacterium]MBT4193865.1 hypothetical protein [Gammaproteobacteria bacterium]MBT6457257.1 hypothetical protein [Gammaproteobacteria bacterium]MBT6702095.1 hypothetical protein [Gammaproteobacteria bacterium]MBT7043959.1 hypothetical protein [Gammaproteobacteria bacterium]
MSFNDAFNHLSQQQQNEYEIFREPLRTLSISSLAETEALLDNARIC